MKPFLNRFVNLFVLRLSQDDICLFSLSLLHSWWLWYAGVPDTQIWPCHHGVHLSTHCSVYISRGWSMVQKWFGGMQSVLGNMFWKESSKRVKNAALKPTNLICQKIVYAMISPPQHHLFIFLRPLIFEVVFFLLKKAQRSSVIYFNHKCHHSFLFLLILFNILLS